MTNELIAEGIEVIVNPEVAGSVCFYGHEESYDAERFSMEYLAIKSIFPEKCKATVAFSTDDGSCQRYSLVNGEGKTVWVYDAMISEVQN